MSASTSLSLCAKCREPSTLCCSKCRIVFYCSRDHQKDDWANHKKICGPLYQVEESSQEGRYLVARRLIKAGQIIFDEPPLVVGPKLITGPLCLGCYSPISGTYRCSNCRWPMCSKACEPSAHHRSGECRLTNPEIMSQLQPQVSPQMYQCIAPLRCLALPDRRQLDSLVSHLDQRVGTDIHRIVERNIVGFIRQGLRLTQFKAEDIQRVCGILDTNCFDIRLPGGKSSIRGLYPTASLMNHDCVPNTWHVFDCSSLRIRVLATVDILPGSKITATYTQSLWNTLDRRGHLKTCKHFWCTCGRCSDPKELGTMLSALSCRSKDCTGLAFSTDPLDHGAMWKCTTCQTTFSDAKDRHDAIRKELKDLVPQSRSCPQLMEDFVRKYSSHIHPSSCHVVEAKFALIQLMGNSSVHLVYHNLTDEQIESKFNYCQQLLKLADVIQPGLSQFRGQLLFEMQAVMEHRARRKFRNDLTRFKDSMNEVFIHWTSAWEILRFDPHHKEEVEKRGLQLEHILHQLQTCNPSAH